MKGAVLMNKIVCVLEQATYKPGDLPPEGYLAWHDCSQSVYVDIKTGEYDYGEPGVPGHSDCMSHCKHGRIRHEADEAGGT